jgi:hypothetical protein
MFVWVCALVFIVLIVRFARALLATPTKKGIGYPNTNRNNRKFRYNPLALHYATRDASASQMRQNVFDAANTPHLSEEGSEEECLSKHEMIRQRKQTTYDNDKNNTHDHNRHDISNARNVPFTERRRCLFRKNNWESPRVHSQSPSEKRDTTFENKTRVENGRRDMFSLSSEHGVTRNKQVDILNTPPVAIEGVETANFENEIENTPPLLHSRSLSHFVSINSTPETIQQTKTTAFQPTNIFTALGNTIQKFG